MTRGTRGGGTMMTGTEGLSSIPYICIVGHFVYAKLFIKGTVIVQQREYLSTTTRQLDYC
jgi:hypothetical protein